MNRDIEPNIEVCDLPTYLIDRVLNAAARPSVGRAEGELQRARKWMEKLKLPSIAPRPATVTAAYRQVGETLEVSTPKRQADCHQCGHEFEPCGVDDTCPLCGGVEWVYR